MNFFEILEEAVSKAGRIRDYARFFFARIKREVPTLKGFDTYMAVMRNLPVDFPEGFSDRDILDFFHILDQKIREKNPSWSEGKSRMAWDSKEREYERDVSLDPRVVYNRRKRTQFKPKSKNLEEKSLNPYQKYSKDHLNSQGHQHSMRRTSGNDTDRKSLKMVPDVRRDLKTPYASDAVNSAQTDAKFLTPDDMEEITRKYGIDFSDKRPKTVKGKTNMVLIPLQNGGWKLERK